MSRLLDIQSLPTLHFAARTGTLVIHINVPKLHTHSLPKFRALLTEDSAQWLELEEPK